MCRMGWNGRHRAFLKRFEQRLEDQLDRLPTRFENAPAEQTSAQQLLSTAAWAAGAVAMIAAGLYAGRELRSRYKFKRRTPYDYYAHSGDRSDMEFGVGI